MGNAVKIPLFSFPIQKRACDQRILFSDLNSWQRKYNREAAAGREVLFVLDSDKERKQKFQIAEVDKFQKDAFPIKWLLYI